MNDVPGSTARRAVLITGGASGIGLATAKRFAEQQFDVLICGRDPAKLANARLQIESFGTACETVAFDLDRKARHAGELVDRMVERFGRIDVLVNNAAAATRSNFDQLSSEHFESIVNVNQRAVFYLTQSAWHRMIQQPPSTNDLYTIVNVSSLAAVDPFPGLAVYGASKAWMELLTRALSDEGKDHRIRLFSIRPGAVETPLLRTLFPDFPEDQVVTPDQVGDLIWTVCKNGSLKSGQAIEISMQK